MNKKLKFIIAGVAIVAGLASAVSCQDLKTDLDNLGKRVSTLENTVKDLQSKIDAGAVITSVTSTATGVKVTLNNGNSFDIYNGKDGANGANGKDGINGTNGLDGAPGTVVTIGENGNWYLDGVDTGLKAAGKDGKDGKDGVDGKDGKDGIDGKDGKDGIDGKDGKDGVDGKDGKDGIDGKDGKDGVDGKDGKDGVDGKDGIDGKDGKDGVDGDSIYWTIEDGKFVEYKNGEKTGNEVSFAEAGQLYAVWADDMITFYNVWDPETETYISTTVYTSSFTPDVEIASISLVEAYSGFELSLFGGTTPTQGLKLISTNPIILPFTNVIEKANVFEEGIKNAYTFEEGKQTPQGWTFVVRVSPANYELKAEDITFVNSMGVTFDEIVAMEVVPYEGLLTKATPANTGLWTVYAELENYDKEKFDALTWVDVDGDEVFNASVYGAGPDRFVSYAIKAQEAVSTYDLAFEYNDFAPATVLNLWVGATVPTAQNIAWLNNRYQGTYGAGANPSLKQPGTTAYEELTWAAPTAKIPTPAVEPVLTGASKNVVVADALSPAGSDDRSWLPTYKAILGEPINIYAGWIVGANFTPNTSIKFMYVTLDSEDNAIESAPSEWNAWTSYVDGIEGLNEVQEAPVASITINKKSADGDIIGFRVYAANQDGTLVDPDGRAFYVQVGQAGDELNAINTVMSTIEQFQAAPLPKTGVATTSLKKISADHYSFQMIDDELIDGTPFMGTFHLQDKNNADVIVDGCPGINWGYFGTPLDLSTITKAYFEAAPLPLYLYEDGKTYRGLYTFYNADNFVVATLPVTFTKTLPATIAQVPVKTSQLGADGKYRCFVIPTTWAAYADVATAEAAGQEGHMDMLSIFNFPKDDPTGYEVTFAASKKAVVSGKNVLQDITVVPDTPLAADNLNDPTVAPNNWITIADLDLIDNKTEHKTTVVYNMGPVSSAKIKWNTTTTPATITSVDDYVLDAGEFQTIYFCIYNEDANYGWPWSWDSSAAWANTDAIAGSAKIAKGSNKLSVVYENYDGGALPANKIIGGSKWDSIYKGAMPTGYNNTINVTDAKLVTATGSNKGKVEYYDVTVAGTNLNFAKKSGATNPTSAVPSELVITYTDMYGHKNVCTVPAEVLKR